jgi:peptidoglycan/LPS O-acetylase OafA/YrhL
MKAYRGDIDGLRAIAVLAVVLFHAGVPGFTGGFVGVDVFFVISGFLISSILIDDARQGRFSLLTFYGRRVRRIFPALFLVLIVTTLAALALLAPTALAGYGKSLAGTGLFASNWVFFLESGYFADNAHQQPLLHTWSLAVEEQYYIVWPLLLWLLLRPTLKPFAALACAALIGVGFAFCVWQTGQNPDAAFYLPFARMWELLIGALLALRPPPVLSRPASEALGWTGLGLIAMAVFGFNESMAFPGWIAAAPCVGAALLLIANARPETTTARLLSTAPMRGVGLVSYSFYLWHWPVLAFATYLMMGAPPWPVGLAMMVPALGMAWVSWRYVERPFRKHAGDPGATRRSLYIAAACCLAAVAVGAGLWRSGGLPQRVPADIREAVSGPPEWKAFARLCPPTRAGDSWTVSDVCRMGPAGAPLKVLVWGDSHAAALAPAIRDALAGSGRTGGLVSRASCPPLVGVGASTRPEQPDSYGCKAIAADALSVLRDNPAIDTVVIVARWSFYEQTSGTGVDASSRAFMSGPGGPAGAGILEQGLRRTVADIRAVRGEGVRVILVGQPPEPGFVASECIVFRRMIHLSTDRCEAFPRKPSDDRQAAAAAILARVAAGSPKVSILPLGEEMCGPETCLTFRDGKLLYRDDDHLSPAGAALFGPDLKALIAAAR